MNFRYKDRNTPQESYELCNQLPEQEYKRISAEICAEDAAEREEREGARTYAAYHVTERGQERCV